MILHTRGRPEESNAVFDEAERVIRHHEEKAVLSLSKGSAQVGSLLVNEKTLPYRGEPFEKVLVNTYKAANYLLLHDYEGARVEIRRSFARQKENERKNPPQPAGVETEWSQKGRHETGSGQPALKIEEGRPGGGGPAREKEVPPRRPA